ncbi:MAG: hypothetical protein AAB403_08630 [Planctomycetota bacterium]
MPAIGPHKLPHALSIDVEDWYQRLEIRHDQWSRYERPIGRSMCELLDLMDECGELSKDTLLVDYEHSVRMIADRVNERRDAFDT